MNNLQAQQKLMAGGKSRASSPPPTPRGAPNLTLPTSPHHHSLNNSLNSTLQNNNIKEFFSRHSFAKNKVRIIIICHLTILISNLLLISFLIHIFRLKIQLKIQKVNSIVNLIWEHLHICLYGCHKKWFKDVHDIQWNFLSSILRALTFTPYHVKIS